MFSVKNGYFFPPFITFKLQKKDICQSESAIFTCQWTGHMIMYIKYFYDTFAIYRNMDIDHLLKASNLFSRIYGLCQRSCILLFVLQYLLFAQFRWSWKHSKCLWKCLRKCVSLGNQLHPCYRGWRRVSRLVAMQAEVLKPSDFYFIFFYFIFECS